MAEAFAFPALFEEAAVFGPPAPVAAGAAVFEGPAMLAPASVARGLRAVCLSSSTTAASGTRSGTFAQEPRTVLARTDSSLSEWRRRETVKCPREKARSASVEVAINRWRQRWDWCRSPKITRTGNRQEVERHLWERSVTGLQENVPELERIGDRLLLGGLEIDLEGVVPAGFAPLRDRVEHRASRLEGSSQYTVIQIKEMMMNVPFSQRLAHCDDLPVYPRRKTLKSSSEQSIECIWPPEPRTFCLALAFAG